MFGNNGIGNVCISGMEVVYRVLENGRVSFRKRCVEGKGIIYSVHYIYVCIIRVMM